VLSLRFSLATLGAALAANAAAVTCVLAGPGDLGYVANNVILNDQVEHALAALGVEDVLIRAAVEADGDSMSEWPSRRLGEPLFNVRIGDGERPHVVLLVMESQRAIDIGALGGRHGVSPQFDRLSKEGVLFTNFHANGIQTTRAVISLLFGRMPRFDSNAIQAEQPVVQMKGLPSMFAARGYHTAYLHNGELSFENQGPFFAANGFQTVEGEKALEAHHPDAQRMSWGIHDEYLYDRAAGWLAERDAEQKPAFLTLFTISNHHPWTVPDHFQRPPVDVSDVDHRKFLTAFAYADHALGGFVDDLRARGLADKTILIVTADTSRAMGEHDDNFSVVTNLHRENVAVPLLILADGRLTPQRIDAVGSQVDVLPTVAQLLGLTAPNALPGTTLTHAAANRTAYFNSPYVLRYWGLRRGSWHYFYAMKARTHHLFDLREDLAEVHNLATERPDLAEEFFLDIARKHRIVRYRWGRDLE